jgi:hypothetical protein
VAAGRQQHGPAAAAAVVRTAAVLSMPASFIVCYVDGVLKLHEAELLQLIAYTVDSNESAEASLVCVILQCTCA